jgi:hypothetical protein
MPRPPRIPSPAFGIVFVAGLLAGCPEGARQEQWTPERDHSASPLSSADALRDAQKKDDEELSVVAAEANAKLDAEDRAQKKDAEAQASSRPLQLNEGAIGTDGTVNGKPLEDVTLDDVMQALTDAGWKDLKAAPRGDTGIQVIQATKGDVTVEVTFVPYEDKPARLTVEEWATLEAEAAVHRYRGFGLAVKAKDREAAKALLGELVKPPKTTKP